MRRGAWPNQRHGGDVARIGREHLERAAISHGARVHAGYRRPVGWAAIRIEQVCRFVDFLAVFVIAALGIPAIQQDRGIREEQCIRVVQSRKGIGARGGERIRVRVVEVCVQARRRRILIVAWIRPLPAPCHSAGSSRSARCGAATSTGRTAMSESVRTG